VDGTPEAPIADLVLNPRGTAAFGRTHVILNGRATGPMRVDSFTGPFSVKSVISGSAVWETGRGRHEVTPGRYLILNHGTTYSLSVAPGAPVETFCLFFRRGFVEEALRSVTHGERALLDLPDSSGESFELLETLHDANAGPLYRLMSAMHRTLNQDGLRDLALSGAMHEAAMAVIGRSAEMARLTGQLPSAKAATRRELVRRLHRARDYMDGNLDRPLMLRSIAREACLSSFHFHRSFRAVFHETPHTYVTRRRLDRAAVLLQRTDRAVIDVALEVGFENAAHFSRVFKRRFGSSPRGYRSGSTGSTGSSGSTS
jgi:AraC family transcriptional regulator